MTSDAVKFNRRLKLIAAMLFASIVMTGVFATQTQAQSVHFRVSSERRIAPMRPVSVRQIVVIRRRPVYRQRVYVYDYPPYYRHYHRHHGVRVWIR